MKWLFALLLVANVVLYLWASGLEPEPATPTSNRPTVNEKSMLLLSEMDPDQNRPEPAEDVAEGICVRIGPFETDNGFNHAAERLDELGLTYNGQSVNARQIQAFRVLLGPYESAEKLEEDLDWLETNRIDAYRRPEPPSAGLISLGLFSQSAAAEAYVTKLSGEGLAPEVRTETRTLGPLRWLEVPSLNEAILQDLEANDWGETEVQVQRSPCK